MKKCMKKKNRIVLIFLVILLLILFLLFKLDFKRYFIPIYQVEDRTDSVKEFEKKEKEENIIGWIRVQGTNIDYPILQNNFGDDNQGNRDYSYAWVNQNVDHLTNYLSIFSHNIRNVSSQPMIHDQNMNQFEQLLSYIYYDFNKENKYIQYTIDGENYLYQIFSVSIVSDNFVDYYSTSYTKKEMKEYIKQSKEDSYFDFDVSVTEDDKIISLITCTRFRGNLTNDFKIDAKLVENRRKGYNYGVKEKSTYREVKKNLEGDGNHE